MAEVLQTDARASLQGGSVVKSFSLLIAVVSLIVSFFCGPSANAGVTLMDDEIPFDPRVLCELDGNHRDNPDAVAEDVALVRDALIAIYPLLPSDLQEHAHDATFVVNHSYFPPTKLYMGWGPEDDLEYEYPDQTLFPEGTIKVNCSERCVQFLRFIRDELGGISENDGARAFVLGFFVHELEHDLQYMKKPVRDLKSGEPEEVCPEGLCDAGLIAETQLKIEYENAALMRQLDFVSEEQMVALARDYNTVVAAHQELFEEGAEYQLLGSDFGNYYMKVLSVIREAGGISGSASVVYHGQYRVPQLALELHNLLYTDSPDPAAVRAIAVEWLRFMDQESDTVKLRGAAPYLTLVEQRFAVDLSKAIVASGMR